MRVYRVRNQVAGDYIAQSWEAVVAFIHHECEPVDADEPDAAYDGELLTVTAEEMTEEEYEALGEWSP